jgi:hypothetical protein
MYIFTNVVQHIIEKQATHDATFTNMDVPEIIYNLTLLFDVFWNKNKNNRDYYIISYLEQQENDNIP